MDSRKLKKAGYILVSMLNVVLKLMMIFIIAYPFIWMVLTSFKPYKETTVYPPALLPVQLKDILKHWKWWMCGDFLRIP